MRRAPAWKVGTIGMVVASLGVLSLTVLVGGAVSASARDKGGAPAHGAPGVGPGGKADVGRWGVATLTLMSSTTTSPTSSESGVSLGSSASTTIDLSSYDLAGSNTLNIGSQSAGAGSGKVSFAPLVVTTSLGPQTTTMLAGLAGHSFPTADLVVRGPRGSTTLDATLGLVTLRQYEVSSASGGTVTLTFEFAALKLAPTGTTPPTS